MTTITSCFSFCIPCFNYSSTSMSRARLYTIFTLIGLTTIIELDIKGQTLWHGYS